MIKLTPRLQMVADLINPCCRFVDIGTDHAYLPVYLVENNKIESALACDIRKGPLENAKKTVTEHSLQNQIDLRLSDGLKEVKADEADAVVIAGMGGLLISEMISMTPWLKDSRKQLVLQPMTHFEDVRYTLAQNGFKVTAERTEHEGAHLYLAISAQYIGESLSYPIFYNYVGGLLASDKETDIAFCNKVITRLEKKYEALKNANKDYLEVENILKEIKNEQSKRHL